MKGLRRLVIGCGDLQGAGRQEDLILSSAPSCRVNCDNSAARQLCAEPAGPEAAGWLWPSPAPAQATTAGGLQLPLPRPQLLPDTLPPEVSALGELEVLELHGVALQLPPPAMAADCVGPAAAAGAAGASIEAGSVDMCSARPPLCRPAVFPKLHSLMLSGSAAQLTRSLATLHRLRPSLRALHLTCTEPTAVRVVPEPDAEQELAAGGAAAALGAGDAAARAVAAGAAAGDARQAAEAAPRPPASGAGIEFDFTATGLGGWGRPVGPTASGPGSAASAAAGGGGGGGGGGASAVPLVLGMLPVNSSMFRSLNRLVVGEGQQTAAAAAGLAADVGGEEEAGLRELSYRGFHLTLPLPQLRRWTSLRSLDMSGNALLLDQARCMGCGWGLLVSHLLELTRLTRLDLSRNRLAALPPQLCAALRDLRDLDVSGNAIPHLPADLSCLSRLTRLAAADNCLASLEPPPLPPPPLPPLPADPAAEPAADPAAHGIANTASAAAAAAAGSATKVDAAAGVAAGMAAPAALLLGALPGLQVLDVSGNRLSALPERLLIELPELRVLRAARNRLVRLPPLLSPCAGDCRCVCPAAATPLPNACPHQQLQQQLSGAASASVDAARGYCYCCRRCCCAAPHRSALRLLDVSSNHLSTLPAAELLGGLAQLQVLAVGQNYYKTLVAAGGGAAAASGGCASSGAVGCGACVPASSSTGATGGRSSPPLLPLLLPRQLLRLDIRLAVCGLREEQASSFLEAVGGLTSLTCLQAQSNALQRLPAAWSRLTRLTRLELGHNRLAALPAGLAELRRLRHLDVSHNCLAALPGPAVLAALTALTCLDASVNALTALPDLAPVAAPPAASSGGSSSSSNSDGGSSSSGSSVGCGGCCGGAAAVAAAAAAAPVAPTGDAAAAGAGLRRLRVLDLHYNSLSELPASLTRLVALRRLDVCRNYGLRRLPPGSATALAALQLVAVGKEMAELALEEVEVHVEVQGREGLQGSCGGAPNGGGAESPVVVAPSGNELWRLAMRGVRVQVVPLMREPGSRLTEEPGSQSTSVTSQPRLVPPGCPSSPVAFLQKTHKVTPRFLDSAVLARHQVQERCGGYHRVLYSVTSEQLLVEGGMGAPAGGNKPTASNSSSHQARVRAVEADIAALQAALGEDGVIVIGPQDFASAFGFEWGKFPLPGNFTWNHCDAPELVWYDLFAGEVGPTVRHVWVAEYDVGWTGDIAAVFGSFPQQPDFVCSTDWKQDGTTIGPAWSNFPLRTWLKDNEVKQCFIMMARYSLRYLQAFLDETRLGHLQFCEMSGAAICAKHHTWCSIHTFDQHSPVVGRDTRGTPMFRFDTHITRGQWEHLAAADAAARQQQQQRLASGAAPRTLRLSPPGTLALEAAGAGAGAGAEAARGGPGGAGVEGRPAGSGAVAGRIYHALKW
ncbi:hypothetical protein HYH02_002247 [Chlamydomonas schloesseri]|uniref:Uncharacterized protein n=1 Tax=Chlamydomonas schloesseri TaxID=2026947 RepID=A0A836BBH1_9CHLO|nr:hypothetical protein HYH02_002247 [Chlamydomonas schloesseri]|eukprot:KAG2452904.1 hypothetical protein HYH02_002247 [Chlamydomonas schloesseri]